jgi:hypothetical protein
MITKADLQTALAHKMGYPLVDLARFPIDPGCDREAAAPPRGDVPRDAAVAGRRQAGRRGRQAVSRRQAAGTAGPRRLAVVPVLARRAQIILALERLSRMSGRT